MTLTDPPLAQAALHYTKAKLGQTGTHSAYFLTTVQQRSSVQQALTAERALLQSMRRSRAGITRVCACDPQGPGPGSQRRVPKRSVCRALTRYAPTVPCANMRAHSEIRNILILEKHDEFLRTLSPSSMSSPLRPESRCFFTCIPPHFS